MLKTRSPIHKINRFHAEAVEMKVEKSFLVDEGTLDRFITLVGGLHFKTHKQFWYCKNHITLVMYLNKHIIILCFDLLPLNSTTALSGVVVMN